MKFVMRMKQTLWLVLALMTLGGGKVTAQEAPETKPGLMVTFAADGVTDTTLLQNVWLYTENGKPVSPFLNPGKFTATWEGFISVDLRDNYTFRAELNGTVKLEVNTNVVLEGTVAGGVSEPGKRARLNKGLNPIKVTYTAPDSGDAYLRLHWSSPDFAFEPIQAGVLSHTPGHEALTKGQQLRLGRELFLESRCVRCHSGPNPAALPDLALDAPDFKGIGSRRNFAWLAHWIENPKGSRALAQMPKMVHGPNARADAEAMAAYLSSLKEGAAGADPGADAAVKGGKLFESLHCTACHVSPVDDKADPKKIALKQVKQKFAPGDLVKFLQKPTEHYEWIRMPNFHLKPAEANELAAFLLSKADAADSRPAPAADAIVRGKQLITSVGCLNCHSGTDNNQFTGKRFGELAADKWTQGCLSETETGKAPFFNFTAAERAALQAFAKTDRTSLKRHVPAEFAERQARNLNCAECHGKFEGFPVFNILGGKLKPEWAAKFIAGEVEYKPRPWIEARMPGFPKYGEGVAHGLAAQHGLPPKAPVEPPIDKEAAEIGRLLVGTDGGFSCIACHAIGKLGATQVFESAGVNLAYTAERLLPSFYHRWLLNPLRIDPQTKMPVYFDQGQSPLTDQYEGSADKQINALWQYIRQGKDMPLPKDAQP